MSSADTTETKYTKKKRTRKPRTTKSKTKKSEEINPPAETTTTEITTPAEQEVVPASVEEIVPETEEKVETKDVVPQVDLPKFEKSLADKITQKFGS
ncbi:MAG: hypothetical protein AABX58_05485, partial [Thermoproteota archaeon]